MCRELGRGGCLVDEVQWVSFKPLAISTISINSRSAISTVLRIMKTASNNHSQPHFARFIVSPTVAEVH